MLIANAKAYAEVALGEKLPKEYTYHNLHHTREVASAAETIAKVSQLTDDQFETLLVAAWLHDTGYASGCIGHEKASAEIAGRLLKEWGAGEQKIQDVQRTILATQMPQNPQDLVGKILCDADLYHLATEQMEESGYNLRKEFETTKLKIFESDQQWLTYNLSFLKAHEYFTEYGKQVLQPLKKQNMKLLKQRLKNSNGHREDKKEQKASKGPERGVETMFRTTSVNHVTLSGMADTKANIMISINTIILSIIVGVLFRKIEEVPQLLIPTLMLVATCLVTIVLAILSTRPNITRGKFTREDIKNKQSNLLFFGNFHNMGLADYEWGMKEMLKDYDFLYGSMIRDIYFLGKVLARKYRFLRLAYTVFMFGFVASIIAFSIAMMLSYNPAK